jgi:hypothetical protein
LSDLPFCLFDLLPRVAAARSGILITTDTDKKQTQPDTIGAISA